MEDTSIRTKSVNPKKNFSDAAGTFVTGVDLGPKAKIEFSNSDVILVYGGINTRWNAHTDCINWISYIP